MKFYLLHVYTLISVALVGSHAAVSPEAYWKSMLPNTPMPKPVKNLLYTTVGVGKSGMEMDNGGMLIYDMGGGKNVIRSNPDAEHMFFLEKDLHQDAQMNIYFMKNDQTTPFLPRKVADSILFSSNKLTQIFNKFSINPDSMEAKIMKQTLNECENKGIVGDKTYCATSLESMVDFSTTELGKNVKVISTEVNSKEYTPLQKYKINGVKLLTANKAVVCHKQSYPYALFYCHKNVHITLYTVSLVGAEGTKVKAVAVCHRDTEKWNPEHLAFQVLKVKPGTVPVCHFLPVNHVAWLPY